MWGKVNKKINTDEQAIDKLLTRGVEDCIVKESLKKKLLSGKGLRVKLGIDPTSSHIHIGRAIILRKLKAFQDLGHKVVLIIGDFTAQIGDASDKLSKRPMLTEKEIALNLKTYKEQIGKILDLKKTEFHFNSKWLTKLNFAEVCRLTDTFSVGQMTSRRNFAERIEKQEEISVREFMYPLMQGYDSVAVKADIELGGFDQLFNLKAGRTIQKLYGQPEQDIMTFKMLSGTDGRKMSSSWGNIIAIDDEPKDMFGKIMGVKDELLPEYLLLTTDIETEKIDEMLSIIKNGGNPRDTKMVLAYENVKMYHGEKEAQKSKDNFINTFSKRDIPKDVTEVGAGKDDLLSEVFLKEGIVSSKADFSRLVKEGAVSNIETGEKIKDIFQKVGEGGIFKIGKHRFVKLVA
jgi:tyrosyl-tRNA synthetase